MAAKNITKFEETDEINYRNKLIFFCFVLLIFYFIYILKTGALFFSGT